MLFGRWFQVRATSCHLASSTSALKSTPKCTWMCWSVWWSPGAIRWPVTDPWVRQQDSELAHKSKETQAWLHTVVLRLCTRLSLPPSSLDLKLLDYFVWSDVKNITNMTSHNTKASLMAAIRPSIRRALVSACGKGILPVPDPYWGCGCGWRRLHWIDVSST